MTRQHPVARLGATIARVPRYVLLAKALLADPGLSKPRKVALVAGLGYLASPIDLVPGIIPVVGQLDDLAAVLLAVRTALGGLPAEQANAHLAKAGLSATALTADIANVRAAAGWTARTTAATVGRATSTAVRAGVALVRVGRRRLPPMARAIRRGMTRSRH